jgi:hypothetical protein
MSPAALSPNKPHSLECNQSKKHINLSYLSRENLICEVRIKSGDKPLRFELWQELQQEL